MPELPEVHTTATMLNRLTKNQTVKDVWTDYHSLYHLGKKNIKDKIYFKEFCKAVIGKKILGVRRRAKNVLIDLSGNITVLIHMKMTGHLLYGKYKRDTNPPARHRQAKALAGGRIHANDTNNKEIWKAVEKGPLQDPYNRFIHLVFTLSNGKHIALSDVRKFAKVMYFETDKHPEDMLALGPEPLLEDFSYSVFEKQILKRPKGKIKQVLMDQTLIAGIGNIYSDEILFAAGVHPASTIQKIPEDKRRKIFKYIKTILKKGIKFKGDSMSDYRMPTGERGGFQYHHKAYRQTGKTCPKPNCKGKIEKIKVGGRSAHFCAAHQKKYN